MSAQDPSVEQHPEDSPTTTSPELSVSDQDPSVAQIRSGDSQAAESSKQSHNRARLVSIPLILIPLPVPCLSRSTTQQLDLIIYNRASFAGSVLTPRLMFYPCCVSGLKY